MDKNQAPKYESSFIQKLLADLISEDKIQSKSNIAKKGDYLKGGLKACKKLNKELDRLTLDR